MPVAAALLLVVALLGTACGGKENSSSLNGPTPSTIPLCQANTTATLTFENRTGGRTHDLFLDNAKVALLGPGQTSQAFTVAATVQHRVDWRYTNTNQAACVATPIPATCSTEIYFCAF